MSAEELQVDLSHWLSRDRPGRYGFRNERECRHAPSCSRASRRRSWERLWLCHRVGMLPQALSATLPTLELPLSFSVADETKSSSCGQSLWLPRSVQPSSARIRAQSRVAHPAILNPLRRPPCRDVLLRLPWLRHTRSEPGSSDKARKTFAAQNSGPAGFSLDSLPSART